MNRLRESLCLYGITDSRWLKGITLAEAVEAAILGGATIIQYREKSLKGEALKAEAVSVQKVCKKYGVPFLVNDYVELAKEIHADGVHVGASDCDIKRAREILGNQAIIGATAKTVDQACAAEKSGADYLGSGAVFGTSTKSDAKPMSLELLKEIASSVTLPVVAIGGIDQTNVLDLKGTGIWGAAVVSGIFAKDHIRAAAEELKAKLGQVLSMKTVLTIAGSDASGGAGIQADLKTMHANGVYGMSAITALTAQNTLGVRSILNASPENLRDQMDAVFEDIFPDAVKIGMIPTANLAEVIADRLSFYQPKNIVLDTVMVATSGADLSSAAALAVMRSKLLPMATVVTPNIPEAEVLSGRKISTAEQMEAAALHISRTYGCAVLLKGGHSIHDANDCLVKNGTVKWIKGERITNPNTHGTGCTLSSAIASNLAKGYSLTDAIVNAKAYVSQCLSAMLDLGQGSGPMKH